MKLTIERADLLRSLGHVQSVVERRNTIPILANVRLSAADGALTLATTDMDIEINETVAANVEVEGATTAPANTLHDIIRKVPDGVAVEIALDSSGAMMTVKAGRSMFKLSCLPVTDFPEIGADDLAHSFEMPASSLRTIIDRTRFAMSTEETRYYLNGIYLHAAENEGVAVLRAVATDGHRLARYEMPLPEGAAEIPGVIVPRKTVMEIRKLVDEAADSIRVDLSDNKVRFSFDHIVLTSKLIDGTFPDYQKVIPSGNDKIVELDPKVFSGAIDRVSTISAEKTRAIKLTINGKTLTLAAQSPDSGSATEDIEVSNEEAQLEIGFNSRYLMDITQQMDDGGCRLTLADSGSPTIIESTNDSSALYVLMPLRV
jgi:DNA polymerase-3 subunit beta